MNMNSDIETMQQNSSILIAAAFTMIGFALGRVTAPQAVHSVPSMSSMPGMHHMEWVFEGEEGEDEVMVIVKSLENEDFEGDTVLSIPGGQLRMVRERGEVQVEVEMEASRDSESGERTVVQKQVIVVEGTEDR